MVILDHNVIGDRLIKLNPESHASGSDNYIHLHFKFDTQWTGLTKTAVFKHPSLEAVIPVLLDADDQCILPAQVAILQGSYKVGVVGISADGTVRIPPNFVSHEQYEGAYGEGNEIPEPTPDIYTQIIAIMNGQAVDAETATDAIATVQGLTNDFQTVTLPAAITSIEEAGQTKVDLATDAIETVQGLAETFEGTTVPNAVLAIETAGQAKVDLANEALTLTQSARDITLSAKDATLLSEGRVKTSEDNTKIYEGNAKISETNAGESEDIASQALADLLAMMGTDLATLVGGKVPMSQIPATATQEIWEISSVDELTGLTAQRADLAEIIEEIDGVRTVTKTYQLLGDGDATILTNWVVWGTSYAVQAGNATTANNAENANTINNQRIAKMTFDQFASAVKDDDTFYFLR